MSDPTPAPAAPIAPPEPPPLAAVKPSTNPFELAQQRLTGEVPYVAEDAPAPAAVTPERAKYLELRNVDPYAAARFAVENAHAVFGLAVQK
jgi:hypothetical protein